MKFKFANINEKKKKKKNNTKLKGYNLQFTLNFIRQKHLLTDLINSFNIHHTSFVGWIYIDIITLATCFGRLEKGNKITSKFRIHIV